MWKSICCVLACVFVPAVSGFSADSLKGEVRKPAHWDRVEAVAQKIDAQFAARWQADGLTAAPATDDSEFVRRVWLDLAGRIPRAADIRDFLDDKTPDKRRRLIDRLIESPLFVVHQTNVWRRMLLPEADADREQQLDTAGFEAWFRDRLRERRSYAEIVLELLSLRNLESPAMNAPATEVENPARRAPSPLAFYQAKQRKPENMTAAVSRLFLGVRLECAQCHDHPFDTWKRERFWEMAAFFNEDPATARTIAIPETKITVAATFLNGAKPDFSRHATENARETLAHWIVAAENPYFSKAAANRLWSAFFGVGLVEPADDFTAANPASHPEVLTLLAETFAAENYDVRFLTRVITATRVYQLSSRRTDATQDHPRSYARMTIRGLTPPQLFDSIAQAIGYRQPFDPDRNLDEVDPVRKEFLETFVNTTDSPVDRPTSLLGVLTLMNGSPLNNREAALTEGAPPSNRLLNRTIEAITAAPFLDDPARIEALFLVTVSRLPRPAEQDRFQAHLKSGSLGNPQSPLHDILWALLNSAEFMTNH